MMNEQNPNDSCATTRSAKHGGVPRSSVCCLNDDLLIEIFSKLPTKSLVSCRSVSKSWRSLISNTLLRPLGPVSGLLNCTPSWNNFVKKGYIDFSGACNSNGGELMESWSGLLKTCLVDRYDFVSYCNGLFLLRSWGLFPASHHICNPAINQCFALPEAPLDYNHKVCESVTLLAFDPGLSPHYKVVKFISGLPYELSICVYIFSSKENRWIDRKLLRETFFLRDRRPVFVNGALHFITCLTGYLYSFDVDDLSGRTIKLPETSYNSHQIIDTIGKCQGRLYCIYRVHTGWEIWMLQNFETEKWLLKHTISREYVKNHPITFNPHRPCGFIMHYLTFHPDKEVVFVEAHGKIVSYHFGSKVSDNDRLQEVSSTIGNYSNVTLALPYTPCLNSFPSPPLFSS